MRRRGRLLGSSLIPALIIAGVVGLTLSTEQPQSGLLITVLATRCAHPGPRAPCRARPYAGLVDVVKPGRHEVIAGHRAPRSGRVRLNLSASVYQVLPRPSSGPGVRARARSVIVRVRPERYTPVTVVYRLIAVRSGGP